MLEDPEGTRFVIEPGPRGKGLALRVHVEEENTSPGRPPRPATKRLRELLQEQRDALQDPDAYIAWLNTEDPGLAANTAKQIVYRELRKIRGNTRSGDAPGRKPSQRTIKLRNRLKADARAGLLEKPRVYVQWLQDRYPDDSKEALAQLVYRERSTAVADVL